MNEEQYLAALQGTWETHDGGDPEMKLIISGEEATNEIGDTRRLFWNGTDEVWVMEGGISVTQLILDREGILTTITPKNGPAPTFSFKYYRVV